MKLHKVDVYKAVSARPSSRFHGLSPRRAEPPLGQNAMPFGISLKKTPRGDAKSSAKPEAEPAGALASFGVSLKATPRGVIQDLDAVPEPAKPAGVEAAAVDVSDGHVPEAKLAAVPVSAESYVLPPPQRGLLCPLCRENFSDDVGLCPDCTGAIAFHPHVERIGVSFKELEPAQKKAMWPSGYHVYIGAVQADSAGEEAELEPGMALCAINGKSCRGESRSVVLEMLKASAGKERVMVFTPLATLNPKAAQTSTECIEELTKLHKANHLQIVLPDAAASSANSTPNPSPAINSAKYSGRVARAKAGNRSKKSPALTGAPSSGSLNTFSPSDMPATPRGSV